MTPTTQNMEFEREALSGRCGTATTIFASSTGLPVEGTFRMITIIMVCLGKLLRTVNLIITMIGVSNSFLHVHSVQAGNNVGS